MKSGTLSKARSTKRPAPAAMDLSKFQKNDDAIIVRGAKVHNLKDVSVVIPRGTLTTITGPSGSGKSSLAFDTIYAEGQRRYVESLSSYARQFLEQLEKPDVESIAGLSPTISIEQRTTSYNPRSTVGTVTEVSDFLRLLYARIAKPVCYQCQRPIEAQPSQQIVDYLSELPEETKLTLYSPMIRARKGEYQKELAQLRQKGFVRAKIDGELRELDEDIKLDRQKKHDISVVVDRLILRGPRGDLLSRISESVELSLKLSEGYLLVEIGTGSEVEEKLFSEKFACSHCNISYPEAEPRAFSFNSPVGACPRCEGLGTLSTEPEDGDDADEVDEARPELSAHLAQYRTVACPDCLGTRLRKESRHYFLHGVNIADLSDQPISSLVGFFRDLPLNPRQAKIADRVRREVLDRLGFLDRVGVGYLQLSRSAQSLSGGEAQRIRLATQIGSSLVGVIYVLDEPSIGLHPRDNHQLIQTLLQLRDLGNTVLVVEHDQETMEASDWIIDMGPGAGRLGGEVVAVGTLQQLLADPASLTGKYLSGAQFISVPKRRRLIREDRVIAIRGAKENNLKSVSVDIPLGVFTVVTGVSGGGKSSLVFDTLYRGLVSEIYRSSVGEIKVDSIQGASALDKVIDIDQSPIGKTPRSNPATYTGLFSVIRDLFAQLPEAQIRGYKPGRFSFNVKGGRCEKCEGGGYTRVVMHFLPDVFVLCDSCQGRRYNPETLEVRYKGKSISDVLALTVEEALPFFDAVPMLKQKLRVLNDVGLGYVSLGQNATTLSGGEAQRIKLSKELSRRATGKTLYILDEPSTGLHFDDVKKLLSMLQSLVDGGNTVVVIEHNLDIIKSADWLIDIGPEGGAAGGKIVVQGTPETVAKSSLGYTSKFIKKALAQPGAALE